MSTLNIYNQCVLDIQQTRELIKINIKQAYDVKVYI